MSASSTVAERLIIPLLPEAAILDVIQEIKDLPGVRSGYWGMSEEGDNTLEIVAICESAEKSLSAAILKRSKSISRSPITNYHISLIPATASTVLGSPIVEMLSFYGLPVEFTADGLNGFLAMVSGTKGCLGVAHGPVLGEVEGGRAWLVMVGWESLEANVRGQKSEAFAKAPKLHVKTELHHVKFRAI